MRRSTTLAVFLAIVACSGSNVNGNPQPQASPQTTADLEPSNAPFIPRLPMVSKPGSTNSHVETLNIKCSLPQYRMQQWTTECAITEVVAVSTGSICGITLIVPSTLHTFTLNTDGSWVSVSAPRAQHCANGTSMRLTPLKEDRYQFQATEYVSANSCEQRLIPWTTKRQQLACRRFVSPY